MRILLIEPNYSNKYPPLGLMKIATFHQRRGDDVIFAKGKLQRQEPLQFDRIYVTTLFTFEWKSTQDTIRYALSLIKHPEQIFIGGVLATLMPDLVRNTFPGTNVVTGLLDMPGKLQLPGDEAIDCLPPSYEILDQIAGKLPGQYIYPAANAYFAYTTRGCGMNCSFCAVKTLEPNYIPRVSIKEQIHEVERLYGTKKDLRNLLLMDNNVLKSPYLREIVDEIKSLGFAKGAHYINPTTGKEVKRIVDFNQGLDANLLTEEKAQLLAELELQPVRIAFDHIADAPKYSLALERCARAGLRSFSNYMLYNTDDSSSFKGKEYRADTPEDFYERLLINITLQERLNENVPEDEKISIYSFPMRYIPLQATERGYIGENWNAKTLRSIQVMLTPSQGKGVGGAKERSFFNAAFGKNVEEFCMYLQMPERILMARGNFVEEKKDEDDTARQIRQSEWHVRRAVQERWIHIYREMTGQSKTELLNLISDNHYSAERFWLIENLEIQGIYLYYFSERHLLLLLNDAKRNRDTRIKEILTTEKALFELIKFYINHTPVPLSILEGYFYFFGLDGIESQMKNRALPSKLQDDSSDQKAIIEKWSTIYDLIKDKSAFLLNTQQGMTAEKWLDLKDGYERECALYYMDPGMILDLLGSLKTDKQVITLRNSLSNDLWQNHLGAFVYGHSQVANSRLTNYLKFFGDRAESILIQQWFADPGKSDSFIKASERCLVQIRRDPYRFTILRAILEYWQYDVLDQTAMMDLMNGVIKQDFATVRKSLDSRFDAFRDAVLNNIPDDITKPAAQKMVEDRLMKFHQDFLARLW